MWHMRYFFFSKKLLKLVAIYDIKSRHFYGTTTTATTSYKIAMLLIKDKTKSAGRLPSDFPQPEQQNDGFLNS